MQFPIRLDDGFNVAIGSRQFVNRIVFTSFIDVTALSRVSVCVTAIPAGNAGPKAESSKIAARVAADFVVYAVHFEESHSAVVAYHVPQHALSVSQKPVQKSQSSQQTKPYTINQLSIHYHDISILTSAQHTAQHTHSSHPNTHP